MSDHSLSPRRQVTMRLHAVSARLALHGDAPMTPLEAAKLAIEIEACASALKDIFNAVQEAIGK